MKNRIVAHLPGDHEKRRIEQQIAAAVAGEQAMKTVQELGGTASREFVSHGERFVVSLTRVG